MSTQPGIYRGKEMDQETRHIQRRVDRLPDGLQAHIYRVVEIARELAHCHGLDEERAAVGMLAHDVARAMPGKELLRLAPELGVPIGLVEQQVPVMLHGPVGSELLRQRDGVDDASLLQAVYWHTTSHPTQDMLGKVVFLADKLDPNKQRRYPYIPQLREMAKEDLDRAILEFLTREIRSPRLDRGEFIHPVMVETRNYLLTQVLEEPFKTTSGSG